METAFILFPKDALNGELEFWLADLSGDGLLPADAGGLSTIFLLDEAFLMGRSGDDELELLLFIDGIKAWS